jgi:hypothetical protein
MRPNSRRMAAGVLSDRGAVPWLAETRNSRRGSVLLSPRRRPVKVAVVINLHPR